MNQTTGKVLAGFVLGALIGTVTGLLLAPTTGNRTRKNINKKAKRLVKQLEGYMGIKPKRGGRKPKAQNQLKNGRAPVASR